MSIAPVTLSADLIEAFAGTFISPRFDDARPTPQFHREAWGLYTSPAAACMVIAPRDHAKSTSLTTVYILAEALFRSSDYIILVGSTEENAVEQLGNIVEELIENDDLREAFKVKKFLRTSGPDIICELADGYRFRILAKGAEQRIRGKLWKGKRPNLLVCDDMEDDEQVENPDRRGKFRRWFFRASPASARIGRGSTVSTPPTPASTTSPTSCGPSGGARSSCAIAGRSSSRTTTPRVTRRSSSTTPWITRTRSCVRVISSL